ncbi:hypothetical protein AYO38_01095 [bacterium SCGC AG-212-C10]|nr:hypothetical protein AYO38_01095 [bacterium SCGC AG-212-C10]
MDYTKLVPVLIRAIQDQQAQIDALESVAITTAAAVPAAFASGANADSTGDLDGAPLTSSLVPTTSGGNAWWLATLAVPVVLLGTFRTVRRSSPGQRD